VGTGQVLLFNKRGERLQRGFERVSAFLQHDPGGLFEPLCETVVTTSQHRHQMPGKETRQGGAPGCGRVYQAAVSVQIGRGATGQHPAHPISQLASERDLDGQGFNHFVHHPGKGIDVRLRFGIGQMAAHLLGCFRVGDGQIVQELASRMGSGGGKGRIHLKSNRQ
jgi:hypothetical protein